SQSCRHTLPAPLSPPGVIAAILRGLAPPRAPPPPISSAMLLGASATLGVFSRRPSDRKHPHTPVPRTPTFGPPFLRQNLPGPLSAPGLPPATLHPLLWPPASASAHLAPPPLAAPPCLVRSGRSRSRRRTVGSQLLPGPLRPSPITPAGTDT